MSILGKVHVATASIVKVASIVGIAAMGILLTATALGLLTTMNSGMDSMDLYRNTIVYGFGMIASIAGWHFADHLSGKGHVIDNKQRQQAELDRLQGAGGMTL